jgi:hypothetical protein
METIIITLLGINLYLLFDYILDNYYFNGNRKGEFLILNRHFFYEFIQIAILVVLIATYIFYLPRTPWYTWIFPCMFILTWSFRIYTTYKNRNCEIQIGKNIIIYINNESKTLTLEQPNYISIQKVASDRLTIQSKATDYVVLFKNEKNEELEINLNKSSLDSYVTQIHKTALRNFGTKACEGIKPWKWIDLKKLSISLLILIGLFGFTIAANIH